MRFIKSMVLVMGLLFSLIMLSGCGSNDNSTTSSVEDNSATDKPLVYASFYPMYDFTSKVVGDSGEVKLFMPNGVEPHGWEPSAKDIANLAKADVLVVNGAGMEAWVDDVISSLGKDAPKLIVASEEVKLRHSGHDRHHDHEEHEAYDSEDHSDHEDHGHHEHSHEGVDPHTWIAPLNAKQEMNTIANELSEIFPELADTFMSNYEKEAPKFDELDKEFKERLSVLPNKEIVVAHEAYGYLANQYGLEEVGIVGLSADEEPDAQRMAQIISFVKEHNVKTIFTEELVSRKTADKIASETDAEVDTLSPVAALTQDEVDAGYDYIQVMQENLDKLVKALS